MSESEEEAWRPAPGPLRRLSHSLSNLAATLLEMVETRLALLATELQEEIYRAGGLLLAALAAIFLATAGLIMAAFALVIAFWDSHRLLVAILVSAGFIAASLLIFAVLAVRLRAKPPVLEQSRAELRRDVQQLRQGR